MRAMSSAKNDGKPPLEALEETERSNKSRHHATLRIVKHAWFK